MEIFREWQRTRTLKFLDLGVGSVFKDYDFHLVCSVEDNLVVMDALSFNYWLAKFIQEVANKKGGRYAPRTLYVIYQTRERVFHQDIQTPRSGLKKRGAAEFF